MKCVEFSVAILYIVFISSFLGWFTFRWKRERSRDGPNGEALLSSRVDEVIGLFNDQHYQFWSSSVRNSFWFQLSSFYNLLLERWKKPVIVTVYEVSVGYRFLLCLLLISHLLFVC